MASTVRHLTLTPEPQNPPLFLHKLHIMNVSPRLGFYILSMIDHISYTRQFHNLKYLYKVKELLKNTLIIIIMILKNYNLNLVNAQVITRSFKKSFIIYEISSGYISIKMNFFYASEIQDKTTKRKTE